MDSKEILKAIDPKGAEIQRLQAELEMAKHKNEGLMMERDARRRHEIERSWMREHGIMIETTEGMKYLKDEDFDKFFKRLKITQYARIGTLNNDVNPLKAPLYDYELLDDNGED
jgi:hypothetical protein